MREAPVCAGSVHGSVSTHRGAREPSSAAERVHGRSERLRRGDLVKTFSLLASASPSDK